MGDKQTTFGQADALAVELVTALNAATFSLGVSAERTFTRRMLVESIPGVGEDVSVQIIPGHEQMERDGQGGQYKDLYGVHVLLQQHVGAAAETQVPLLLCLRDEIVEYLCGHAVSSDNAVHPFAGAVVQSVKHGPEGLYDLGKLESENVFYSDLIVTYRPASLRRNG